MITPTTQVIYGGYGTLPSPPSYSSSGQGVAYKMEIPAPMVTVNKTLQYEFRVLESTQNGEVVKVGLQVKIHEIDHFGGSITRQDWTDVERVRLEL